jgi:hypothetical protein
MAGALRQAGMPRLAVEVARAHRGDVGKLGLGAGIESKLVEAPELLGGL